jgi:hypothetical protein
MVNEFRAGGLSQMAGPSARTPAERPMYRDRGPRAAARDDAAELARPRGLRGGRGGAVRLIVAAGRVRGVCEHWSRSAMRWWEVLALYGPPAAVALAGAVGARIVWLSPVVASAVVFVLFAGAGFALSARAARR